MPMPTPSVPAPQRGPDRFRKPQGPLGSQTQPGPQSPEDEEDQAQTSASQEAQQPTLGQRIGAGLQKIRQAGAPPAPRGPKDLQGKGGPETASPGWNDLFEEEAE